MTLPAISSLVAMLFALLQTPESGKAVFHLKVTNAHGYFRDLTLGVHAEATYEFDASLGEFAIPPFLPTEIFDARFIDLPGRPRDSRTGSESDIRKMMSTSQVDTFLIRFQPGNGGSPVTLVRTETNDASCDSMILSYSINAVSYNLDLNSTPTVSIPETDVGVLRLVVFGPHSTR